MAIFINPSQSQARPLQHRMHRLFPKGTSIRYTGTRLRRYRGKVGIVIGYRSTNGLVVQFRTGLASITFGKAKVIGSIRSKKARRGSK